MKRICILVLLLLESVVNFIFANTTFANKKLETIYQQVLDISADSEQLSSLTESGSEFIINDIHISRAITISYDSLHVVNHIGFKIFDRSIISENSLNILNFVERYLLELMLLDEHEIQDMLIQHSVNVFSDIYPTTTSIKDCLTDILSDEGLVSSIKIILNQNRQAVVCYKENMVLLNISFPTNRELITAQTKIEAEQKLFSDFNQFITKYQSTDILNEEYLKPYKDDLYYAYDNTFLKESMRSTSFYSKQDNRYLPVFDNSYPTESTYNLFNAYNYNYAVRANVSFSFYKGDSDVYECPLNAMISFLRKAGCQLYTGIKQINNQSVEGIVLAVNNDLGYSHMMIFSVDRRILIEQENHKIKIKMYCYIPLHNVASLLW